MILMSAYDITSGVHTNAHEDAFSAPRTNVRLVAVFGAFKVPRVHSCALHLHYPLGYSKVHSKVHRGFKQMHKSGGVKIFKNLAHIMALKRVGRKSVFGLSCIDALTDADADADANGDGCAVG